MTEIEGFLAAALAVSALAAWFDLRAGVIPNAVSYVPLVAAPVAHFAIAYPHGARAAMAVAGFSVLGGLLCAAVPFLFFVLGGGGGGDVKLLAAVGALLLPAIGVEAEMYGFVGAALFAPARLAWEGKLLRTLGNTAALALNPLLPRARRREVPHEALTWFRMAPAIFAGVVLVTLLHWRGG